MGVIDLCPPIIRFLFFKAVFKKLGKDVLIDYSCYFRYPSKISIGNNVAINRGCKFFGSRLAGNYTIKIGNNVAIGPEVTLLGAGHDYTRLSLPDSGGNIIIKDNVWIGACCTIIHGVTVGEGSVIAAGSLVTKNIPPYVIVAGIPAKIIKKREIKDNTTSF